jgi:hypothetical protein
LRRSETGLSSGNDAFIAADKFKKNAKIKEMPHYSIPKTIYHSAFGPKPNDDPSPGPGAHSIGMKHFRSGSSIGISPGKYNRSLIDESRARIESSLGPGRYSVNLYSLPMLKKNQSKSFGRAPRNFKVTDSVEVSKKKLRLNLVQRSNY